MNNEALIIIDMQEGFRYPESEIIIPKIIERTVNFKGLKIFTQFFDVKGSLFERQLNWPKFQEEYNQRLMKDFDIIKEKMIFKHSTYSIISKELVDFFKSKNIKKVFLTGIYTDVSILKSSMDFFDLGFEVFVIENCCNSIHKDQKNNLHESGIESIGHIIGKNHII